MRNSLCSSGPIRPQVRAERAMKLPRYRTPQLFHTIAVTFDLAQPRNNATGLAERVLARKEGYGPPLASRLLRKPSLIYTFSLSQDRRTSQEQRTFHAEAYIPTQPAQAIQEARISHAHEDPGRPEGFIPPPRQGAQAGLSEAWFPRIVPCAADHPRTREHSTRVLKAL